MLHASKFKKQRRQGLESAAWGGVPSRVVLCIVIGLYLFAVPFVRAGETDVPDHQRPELWFPVGEELVYRIYWGIIPVGESVVTTEWMEKNGKVYLVIRIVSKTNKVLSTVYPVEDTLESIIDPDTFLPVQFMKNMKEGGYRAHEVNRFDHESGKARLKSFTSGKLKEYDIKPDTRDLISFMYYMRQFDMEPGKTMNQQVMADEDIYDITIDPIKYEKVKTVQGERINSLKIEPKAEFNGLFVRKGRGWVWVSREGERVITKIAAEVPVANVKLILDEVNMRDPDNSNEQAVLYDIPAPDEPDDTQKKEGKSEEMDAPVPMQ